MSGQTRAIKQKIGSVSNIQKITRTMEMVAAAKMKRAIDSALATREYAVRLLDLLSTLSRDGFADHPLMQAGSSDGDTLFVIIGSNKGLCGGYNTTLERSLRRYLGERDRSTVKAVTIGRYAESIARKLGVEVQASFVEFDGGAEPEELQGVSEVIKEEFMTGDYDRVRIVYEHFESAIKYRPTVHEILPISERVVRNMLDEVEELDPETHVDVAPPSAYYTFEPSSEEVLSYALEHALHIMLYQAYLEAQASEHSARRVAMKNATDSAEEMVGNLTLSYNRARQGAITQEISEISAGVEAQSD